jgi:tripartite-type tricarboxylate transporter receptor subunit TctC
MSRRRGWNLSRLASVAITAACLAPPARGEEPYPSRLITIVAPITARVPYTVSATIIADLLGGRIQASFVPMAFVLPLLQDGRLKALAVAAKEPITEPVAIATAQSQGIDYQYATWYGVLAPGKTPKSVLDTLDQAIAEAGNDPELQAKIRIQGIEPRHVALAAFDAHIRDEMARLAPLLKSIGENR